MKTNFHAGVRPIARSRSLASGRKLASDIWCTAFWFLPWKIPAPKISPRVMGIISCAARAGMGEISYNCKLLIKYEYWSRPKNTSWCSKISAPTALRWYTSTTPLTRLFAPLDHWSRITYVTAGPPENQRFLSLWRWGQLSDQPLSTTTVGRG